MILIVDMNQEENSIWKDEFVEPIVRIAEGFGRTRVVHWKRVSEGLARKAERIILSGSPLGETGYLKDMEKFSWLSWASGPVLGICAGMQVIGKFFTSRLDKCTEIGMIDVRTIRDNPLMRGDFQAYCLHAY
jgi:GMP synthase-like glutamine amidotransferase